ncbi:MAG: zinc/iron permease [Bacteroidetes bacterium]|nr:MAG: zinc/iron permease [Bacteroidota bacterium]
MNFWVYLSLVGSVALGGVLAAVFQRRRKRLLPLMLSFSGAYLLAVSVLHLAPEVFASAQRQVPFYVLGGFFLQLVLEQLSGGVEHGHLHGPRRPSVGFALAVMLGLSLHALFEGLPLEHYHHLHRHEPGGGWHLLYGLLLHKVPAAFALALLLLESGYPRRGILLCLTVFALMTPLGGWLGQNSTALAEAGTLVLAFVLGSFLHISTTILFEMDPSSHHRINPWKLLAVLSGLGAALLSG